MTHELRVGAALLDDVDRTAMATFAAEHPDLRMGEVAIVIAAYNEAANIKPVLEDLPDEVLGMRTSVLVVDDGSKDGTADIARSVPGVLVVTPPRNRGQGAALRLGYHVARVHGAQYIVTTDADGQYDDADIPVLVKPLVEDRADFASGSRRLGMYTTDDVVRHAGVRVFASVMSVLARRRITDTSNGLRAFRADVVDHLALEQPQYQATELLLGVLYRGFRYVEIGTSMHQRTSGASKKGPNLVYGYRFGRVILRTWWRELNRNRREGRTMGSPSPLASRVIELDQSREAEDTREAG